MEAYRDQYASVFRGGRGVTVLAISNDSAEELASWADDSDFPVLFGSDEDHSAASSFGLAFRESGNIQTPIGGGRRSGGADLLDRASIP